MMKHAAKAGQGKIATSVRLATAVTCAISVLVPHLLVMTMKHAKAGRGRLRQCAPGYSGDLCDQRVGAASAGDDDDEACSEGWAGEDCDECAPGYSGDLCDQRVGAASAGDDDDEACGEGWAGKIATSVRLATAVTCAISVLVPHLLVMTVMSMQRSWAGEDCDECAPITAVTCAISVLVPHLLVMTMMKHAAKAGLVKIATSVRLATAVTCR